MYLNGQKRSNHENDKAKTLSSQTSLKKESGEVNNPKIIASKPVRLKKENQNFTLLQNGLYYFVIDHQRFPKKLNELIQKKYLKEIPIESTSKSNQVFARFSGEGGWVYNPPKTFAANKIEEQIGIALFPNAKNIPFNLFYTLSIKINLDKSTLFVTEGNDILKSWPISVGSNSTPTPVGNFRIIEKHILKNEDTNFYGSRWMQLGEFYPYSDKGHNTDIIASRGIGIHGTNDPTTVGKPITLGCIRMCNDDIEELYQMIPNGVFAQITTY